jgi:hypothetical protein
MTMSVQDIETITKTKRATTFVVALFYEENSLIT